MHFGVCFFCVLLASESFVTAMPRPSFRNVLETQQIKGKNSEVFNAAPRIFSSGGRMQDSLLNEGDYDSLYKSFQITNNARNSPISKDYRSSNEAVNDDSGYINAFVQDSSISKLTPPVNTLREPDVPVESSSVTIPLPEAKHVQGTTDQKNIPPKLSPEVVQPVDSKFRKPFEGGQNTRKGRTLERRQDHKVIDEVASGFIPHGMSQVNDQKKDEHHLSKEKHGRGRLRRKQRNTGVFWRKRDMPVLGYDTSGMLGDPADDSLLPNNLLNGLESSTQYSYVPYPRDISYGSGRNSYPVLGSINSPEVYEDDEYRPIQNIPLNPIQSNVAVQNYQQDSQPFQPSRAYDHNYQPPSSLINDANDIPSNTYLKSNGYQSETMSGLPAEPNDYHASSLDEDTMSFNKYLPENDNIEFRSQEVLPHVGEIKYLTENHDQDYQKKYSYSDGMSNLLNQYDRGSYPGLLRDNLNVGANVAAPSLSDSFPGERVEKEKLITYNNHKKTKTLHNNKNPEDYSSNREFQEKFVEDDNHIDNVRGYYTDTGIPNAVEQRYPYDYPGSVRELPDRKKYVRVSPHVLHNQDTNKVEIMDSDFFPPKNSISHIKSDKSSSSFNRPFTSEVRPEIVDTDMPRTSQYKLQKNMRKSLFKRHKKPRKYVSVRRNSEMSPFTQDNEYAAIQPKHYRTPDAMIEYDYIDSDSKDKNQVNMENQRQLQYESQMPQTIVLDRDSQEALTKLKKHCPGTSISQNASTPGPDTFDPLNDMDENCIEESEISESGSTEATTLSSDTDTDITTTEEGKQKEKSHKKNKNNKNTTSEPICKTDFPCSVNGDWYSHIGGILLSLRTTKDGELFVSILNTPSYYTGHGLLSNSWNITGEIPFNPRLKSFVSLRAINCVEHKFATFMGECFTCGSEDVIYGSWLFGRPAHSCKDQHISTSEYKDILRKSHINSLKSKCKKLKQKPKGE